MKLRANEGEFWTSNQRSSHSLHEIPYRACFKPELAGFFIDRFTTPGETVYDPFMGRGTTPLEAALRGRIAMGSDANPLGEMLAAPRLDPPAFEEITDWLDVFDWQRDIHAPAELLAFFHPETLRKICLLRTAFLEHPPDRVSAWIRMVALTRLTGHSPGFFSVRTLPPNQAITAAAQLALNKRHNLIPPPRDVAAIILKKSRSLLRHASRPNLSGNHRLWTGCANCRGALDDNSVALVVTSPPFLDVVDYRRDNWMRCWFAGIDSEVVPRCTRSLEEWKVMLTGAMIEIERILRPGGHAAVEVGEIRRGKILLEEHVLACGQAAGLDAVQILIHSHSFTKTSRCWGIENNKGGTNTHRVVVFRKS
ncbi:MAG: DNA methyltransferase [Spartobacteria bacterium]